MSVQKLDGSILISKHTLLRLIQGLRPATLGKDATLFQCGMEEQKRLTMEHLKKELQLETGFNPANDVIRQLQK
jgi:hypothetical protein